ncbi:beta strand repeat-containing protein [Derxia gummosa]|uniref:Beta strand repeat-containing protein n=1 Tax=Derxia gummosa DSM 723 TaxID=1121388 RepID=A0A8B6X960_9BURK|nr:calcium-binding protein [Derxia gummosa]
MKTLRNESLPFPPADADDGTAARATAMALIGGTDGNDFVFGTEGADTLDGGLGNDTMRGFAGDDRYYVDSVYDQVIEAAGGGTDTVVATSNHTLSDQVENLILAGNDAINGTGNSQANRITGNSAANVLNGGGGADTLEGGAGNDSYVVDSLRDEVIETSGNGDDTVQASLTWRLGNHLENLVLLGANNLSGYGNALDNRITGNVGSNLLDGGAGADTLVGGLGNDTYQVDDAGDVVVEGTNAGIDVVRSSISYTLGNNVEYLVLTGSSAISGTGNALDNRLTGNSGNNSLSGGEGADTLDGGEGADTLTGGGGNDIFLVDDAGDRIVEAAIGGNDTVQSTISLTLSSSAEIENLTLIGSGALDGTGNALDNRITGNAVANALSGLAGNDTLDGGAEADTLAGGTGDDTYVVDNVDDQTIELAGEGRDLVQSSISWTLGTNLEDLTLTGSSAINGIGNALDNRLTGNSGNNLLNGGLGDDTLAGAAGNDIYRVDSAGDEVVELTGGGTDTVRSTLDYTLGVNVENLTLIGNVAVNGTGNALANSITGNANANALSGGDGNDTLDGSAGADTMIGGGGDDTYLVDNRNDVTTEVALGGTADLVKSTISWTLAAEIENLTLTGTSAINGSGNALANLITGNSAFNVLTGGDGNDTLDGGAEGDSLIGGAGNDVYVVDNLYDEVVEADGVDVDRVESSVNWQLGANLENLTLTGSGAINGSGNALDNLIRGNSGANVLDGGAGIDTLEGGAGNDLYVVDSDSDVINELAGGGTDGVESTVSWTLGAELENLVLVGGGRINGTGNALANSISGNLAANLLRGGDGNDTLDGGAGSDTLEGGAGNDTYVIDSTADRLVEAALAGNDTVLSYITKTLALNFENLTLLGSSAINGTGNADANMLIGNSASNRLDGAAGNDTLDGGAGADTLIGGSGDDSYVVDSVRDIVTELAGGGTDTVTSSVTLRLGANLERLTLGGSNAIDGFGNELDNVLTGNGASNVLNGGAGHDTLAGGGGNDFYVVDSTEDSIVELANGGTDTVRSSVNWTLGTDVENLTLVGTADIDGYGNGAANLVIGNSGMNRLFGYEGADTLDGGEGADSMTGGNGDDSYYVDDLGDLTSELPGGGIDTVRSSISWTLGTNVENLLLTGTLAINGSGNELGNFITGNGAGNVLAGGAGNDTLDGGADADTLIGGAGSDAYIVDSAEDTLIELAADTVGTDTVNASVSWRLDDYFEDLVLTGSNAIDGFGNAAANRITGNTAANILNGGAGADTLSGGQGNDTYVVDNSGDQTLEAASAGIDLVKSSLTWTLAANLENLTLTGGSAINGSGNELANVITGNAAANLLSGNAGADTLIGGAGADTLVGGSDSDTYVVSDGDITTESAGGGTADLVLASISWTLASQIENLTLTGSGSINGTGNELDNTLTGNSGTNVLTGLAGNDSYVMDSYDDSIVEAVGGGTDTVRASISWELGSNLENLTLTGSGFIDATGNGADNTITGNTGNNIIDGRGGSDLLTGGGGNDVFVFSTAPLAGVTDTVTDFVSGSVTGYDRLRLDQPGIRVGNGDGTVDGAILVDSAPSGSARFAVGAEFVVFGANISGTITSTNAAAMIGSATSAFATGDTRVFAVDNGSSSSLFLFTSSGDDAAVSASELTLIANLTGTAGLATGDLLFGL